MKTVLVTGGTGGIGSAVCRALYADGFSVLFTYHRGESRARALETELPGSRALPCDLTKEEGLQPLLDTLADVPLYGLVHCAGVSQWGLCQDGGFAQVCSTIACNLTGPVYLTGRLLPGMIRAGQGRIVMLGSVWGSMGASCETVYSAAKGGVEAFCKALAKEVGPSGITVNCVAPGLIDTAMNSRFSRAELDAFVQDVPVGRQGRPEEVAALCSFLMSEKAGYITGQVIGINGGII